jgi:exonuclease V
MVEDIKSNTEPDLQVPAVFAIPQLPLKAPIHRFRATRPLSVSDLVSPTWCELQYSNNLNKHGRIPRTKAMKQGSEVHKTLELEVHEFVPVEVRTQEDSWGLRLWNVIQGLRTLRAMGMTRELDVWGVVDGEVVSGVIDELTMECPDSELEMALQVPDEPTSLQKKEPEPDQMTIDEFFAKRSAKQEKIKEIGQQVYLIDTKTRAYPNLPSESSMRPTKIQLMLYRHLLSLQASGSVDGDKIFNRYGLNANEQFSAVFIDEISQLESNLSSQSEALSSQIATVSELRTHSTLASLWSLMATEFVITFAPLTLSPILTAVYRSQSSGNHIGQKSFVHDDSTLAKHIDDELQWWRGKRAPRGVEIEDTFKCKFCEFADDCSWRMGKEAEHLEKVKNKVGRPRGRSKSKSPSQLSTEVVPPG